MAPGGRARTDTVAGVVSFSMQQQGHLWARRSWRLLAAVLLAGTIGIVAWLGAKAVLAARYHRLAKQALARYDFRQALKHIEQSLAYEPDDGPARLLAAQTARRLDRYAEAARHLSAYEQIHPADAPSEREWFLLGIQQGDLAGQERTVRSLAERDGDDAPLILEAMGKGYLNCFCWPDAIECLTAALKKQPIHVFARVLRAQAYEGVRLAEPALADYRQAVEDAPQCYEARLGLAAALQQGGFTREAIAHYEFLHGQAPDEAAVLLGLARCYFENHDLELTQSMLQRLCERHPDHVPGLVETGRLALYQQRWADAERMLLRAQALAPPHLETHRLLEALYEARGDEKRRRAAHERLQEIHVSDLRLVRLLNRCRDFPRDPQARYDIGQWKQHHGDEPDGLRWWFSSLFVDERFTPTHAVLAAYYQRTGQARWVAYHRQRVHSAASSAQAQP
jgi:tetratricopeptide (TPR) repeat protein